MEDITKDNLTGTNNGPLFPNTPLKYLTASSVKGDKVLSITGEHLGEIKDIMLDIVSGKIEYYVLEFGGFLGLGAKYFAIPFGLLTIDAGNKSFVFNQSKEMLEKAPGFDDYHWPETNIHLEQVHQYWNFMG